MNLLVLDMFRGKILVLVLFSIYFLSSAAEQKIQNTSFSALIAFGDSVLDTGNNNRLLTLLKGNYWPYGWNFDYKIPTGRFGNGRVFTDIVGIYLILLYNVSLLKIKITIFLT